MGVHEYVCFVQQNGQNIEKISDHWDQVSDEEDNYTTAIIVHLPGSMNYEEIKSMKLTEFSKYPYTLSYHDWDSWEFEKINGYGEVLMEENTLGDRSIWRENDDPNTQWNINFYQFNYDAFVLGKYNPDDIPLSYYEIIIAPRIKMPMWRLFPTYNKKDMYEFIISNDWSKENISSRHIPINDIIINISVPYDDYTTDGMNDLAMFLKRVDTGDRVLFLMNSNTTYYFKPGTYYIEQYMIDPYFTLTAENIEISYTSRNIRPQDDIDRGPNITGFNKFIDSKTGLDPKTEEFKWKDQYIDTTYSSIHPAITLKPK